LAGYTDVQMPFHPTTAGKFEITATLTPTERRPEGYARTSGGTSRHGRHEKKQPEKVAAPAAVNVAPSPQPQEVMQPATIPPLGDRNPVRRLGR